MKDQLRLLRDCINNDRPAVVFQGDDFCAPEILEAAKEIYRKHGCWFFVKFGGTSSIVNK